MKYSKGTKLSKYQIIIVFLFSPYYSIPNSIYACAYLFGAEEMISINLTLHEV